MRAAIVSTFFPNSQDPYRAVFVRHLVTAMARRIDARMVAPVPYAPPWPRVDRWRRLRAIAPLETQDGIEVLHPRFIVLPKLEALTGCAYGRGVLNALRSLQADGLDVLHAHCSYPDGVGVARVALKLGIPYVITAHGSDINVYSGRRGIRGQLDWAFAHASAVIAVSEALRRKICELFPAISERVTRIPCCGFDGKVFAPADRALVRARIGIPATARVVVFVGRLIPIKSLDCLLRAWLAGLEQGSLHSADQLLLIGDGEQRAALQSIADSASAQGTVKLLGAISQSRIAEYLQSADVLCLPSLNEGLPNAIVEAFASGIPVVATAVGGVPELVQPRVNGLLVPPSAPHRLLDALLEAFARNWDGAQITQSVSGYTWDSLAERNVQLLAAVVGS